jgi:CubicO group peptidase (beta-lactamase class C family)
LINPMKKMIGERVLRAIEDKVFPGCVVGFTGRKIGTGALAFGRQTYDGTSPLIKEDSIFDVASITKAIPTSSLALVLVDRGRLGLDDPLIRYVPELSNSSREKVLIRHLLTQTLDYNFRLSSVKDRGPDGILKAVFSSEFTRDPGTSFFYSNATSILLGLVVERVFEKSLDAAADQEFFAPLCMSSTSFFCDPAKKCDVVPTEIDPWRGRMIQAEVHDESAWALRRGGIIAGSAGLFSTVADLLKFLEILLNRGVCGGKRYFSENIVAQMHTNQLGFPGVQTGLGWELFQKRYMGSCCTGRTIGKTGFTGCVCVCDFGKQAGFVLLSNYTFPNRKPDSGAIDRVRRDIADIIFSHE